MCSYIIEKTAVSGSAKGPNGWMRIDTANVYFDHPYHAPFDHALAIDFVCEADGANERVRGRAERGIGARTREDHPCRTGERRGRAYGIAAPRGLRQSVVARSSRTTTRYWLRIASRRR